MSITVIAVGKKHESWVREGVERYTARLRKPYDVTWKLVPHSAKQEDAARQEESGRILQLVKSTDHLMVLDERGSMLSSPKLATRLQRQFDAGKSVVCVIGGAYGVSDELRSRAQSLWSLSDLVFPHQLVRLIVSEQVYRAQEISAGRPYHHV